MDARRANLVFKDPPGTLLATPESFARLEVDSGVPLYQATVDVDNCCFTEWASAASSVSTSVFRPSQQGTWAGLTSNQTRTTCSLLSLCFRCCLSKLQHICHHCITTMHGEFRCKECNHISTSKKQSKANHSRKSFI